jgi:hypothetical protein
MMVESVGIVGVPGYSAVLGIELVEPEIWGVLETLTEAMDEGAVLNRGMEFLVLDQICGSVHFASLVHVGRFMRVYCVGDGVRAGCFMMMFCVGGRPTSVLICAVFWYECGCYDQCLGEC